ncbi:MAG: hypothetical protein HN345_05220 [Planctomycetaceae bacterium]|jgi:predicted enzyme related to lactoylglutathione lyase|nr:hypothetical protein [Planctomycetaceae bacterium]
MPNKKWQATKTVPILIVSDIEKAVQFYSSIGFEETFRNDTVYSVLRLGSMFVHLGTRMEAADAGTSQALIEIEDVDDYYALCMAKNATIEREIEDQFYGLRSFNLKDRDGNLIEFAEPIKKGPKTKAKNPIIIHYVNDMERAKKFYTQTFCVTPLFESSGWTTIDFGAIELALHILNDDTQCEGTLPHAGLNLEVDNIEEIQTDIERLGGQLTQLREPSGGVPVRVATCQDSEGNGFELRQQP